MPNLISPWWSQLKTVVAATWEDILPANGGGGMARVVSLQKVDWERLRAPYVPVTYSTSPWPDAPLDAQVLEITADLYYIRADAANRTVDAIEEKLGDLDDALTDYAFENGVQFLEVVNWDTSERNPANEILLALNQSFSAGSLRVRWLSGETY